MIFSMLIMTTENRGSLQTNSPKSSIVAKAGGVICGKKSHMMQQIDLMETTRAYAGEMWMPNAPMPMVTFFKTLDVTRVLGMSCQYGLKFNMLICWCMDAPLLR